jgi:hypothetical protein
MCNTLTWRRLVVALADRQIDVTQRLGRIDAILTGIQGDLPEADREWLRKHLTATNPAGQHIYPADRIAATVAEEYPDVTISASLIRSWRRENSR